MKLKIKINEAIDTPGTRAAAAIDAEKITNDPDNIDKMDKEIEDSVGRVEDRKLLKDMLEIKFSPDSLPIVVSLLKAHNKAKNEAYNIDGLWESIKKILLNSKTAISKIQANQDIPGVEIIKLVQHSIKTVSSLEGAAEDNSIDSLISDLVSEDLEPDDVKPVDKLKDLFKQKEKELGRKLTANEKWKYMVSIERTFNSESKKVELKNLKSLLATGGTLVNNFEKNLEQVINNIAAKKQDPVKILLNNPDFTSNIKGIFIINRVLDKFVSLAMPYFSNISKASISADQAATAEEAVDILTGAQDRFSEVYRKFNIEGVIDDASEAFDNKIYSLAVLGQDKLTGGLGGKVIDKAADLAGRVEVGLDENILKEILQKEDYNVIFALALYKDYNFAQIEDLSNKFKSKDKIDPQGTQAQIYRIYNFFEEEYQRKFDQTLGKSLQKLKQIYKNPKVNAPANKNIKDEIKNLIKDYLNKKNILRKSVLENNKKLQDDPKTWVKKFKFILNKLESFNDEKLKDDLKDAKDKSTRLRRRRSDINSILLGVQPYEVTLDIAIADKPDIKASQAIAYKISNNIELNNNEQQYYVNNPQSIEDQLKILQNLNELLIKENYTITNNSNVDVSQLENIVARFYPYVKQKLKFNKDVKLNFISDPENAKDPWGKTAYYNPNSMEVTIFVDGRHPKDMLRSISHELVHHAQNCRGEFDQAQSLEPGYAQKDPHMRRMEGEAYLLGNGFLVRDFEDYLKSQGNQNLTENKK